MLSSCERFQHDSGPYISENRNLDTNSFHTVSVAGSMDVLINKQNLDGMLLEGGENVLPYIVSEVNSSELRIYERHNSVFDDKSLRVSFTKHYLEGIEHLGSGDLQADEINADSFYLFSSGSGDAEIAFSNLQTYTLNASGSGDITTNGSAENFSVIMSGSGELNARYLHADDCTIVLTGSGDANLFVDSTLNVTLTGSGNIRYWGNPLSVNVNVSGSGSVIHMQ
jgi:hypothetical protein